MALPTQKRTKSSRKKRALHFRIEKAKLTPCPECRKPVLSYRACHSCGHYASRKALKPKEEKKKKKKK